MTYVLGTEGPSSHSRRHKSKTRRHWPEADLHCNTVRRLLNTNNYIQNTHVSLNNAHEYISTTRVKSNPVINKYKTTQTFSTSISYTCRHIIVLRQFSKLTSINTFHTLLFFNVSVQAFLIIKIRQYLIFNILVCLCPCLNYKSIQISSDLVLNTQIHV